VTTLCKQPEALASDLSDDQSRYLFEHEVSLADRDNYILVLMMTQGPSVMSVHKVSKMYPVFLVCIGPRPSGRLQPHQNVICQLFKFRPTC